MDPRAKVFYLFGDMTPPELKEMGFAGFNYLYSVVQKHPEWIAQTKTLGLISGAWTVDSTDAMKEMIGYGVDFITTNEPEKLQALLK